MNNKILMTLGALLFAINAVSFASVDDSAQLDTEKEEEPFSYGLAGELSEHYNSFAEESDWLDGLWGRPFRNRLYLGMWSLHFGHGDYQNNNQLVSLSWNGIYGGTFANSQNDRVFSAGVQRTLYQTKWHDLDIEAGYRLGVLYCPDGYKGIWDAKWLPFPQTVLDIDYKGFGVELGWAGVVFTAGLYYRF